MADLSTCRVCGEPADTIRDGHDYCARHHEGHTLSLPIVVCAIAGCGCPVYGSSELCRDHHAHRATIVR